MPYILHYLWSCERYCAGRWQCCHLLHRIALSAPPWSTLYISANKRKKSKHKMVDCSHICYVYIDSLTICRRLSQSLFTHMYWSKRNGAEILQRTQKPPLIILLSKRDLLKKKKQHQRSNLLTFLRKGKATFETFYLIQFYHFPYRYFVPHFGVSRNWWTSLSFCVAW